MEENNKLKMIKTILNEDSLSHYPQIIPQGRNNNILNKR